ncbi:MAG: helix-turn-helix domain-containing protein, partial [Bacteroidales bacterium]|nr:helix-turn-helix domain-containing protein [Bacteroidales bacterium]
EIAYKVGFSGQSYFSAAFHEYFGMTPTEFALQYGGGNRDRVDHLFE